VLRADTVIQNFLVLSLSVLICVYRLPLLLNGLYKLSCNFHVRTCGKSLGVSWCI